MCFLTENKERCDYLRDEGCVFLTENKERCDYLRD